MPVVHIIIPVYNEEATLTSCLTRIAASPLPADYSQRLIIIDDASTDRTPDLLTHHEHAAIIIRHETNRGKGASLLTGFDAVLNHDATQDTDLILIQDADLEYDPADYARLLAPLAAGRTRVVFGTRFGNHHEPARKRERLHALGNRALTRLSNFFTGHRLTDMECCYKLVTIEVLKRIRPMLNERRFGIEPQLAASLARIHESIEEVPVSYTPRGFNEGKKIKWRDGVRAIWVILREGLFTSRRIS